MATAACILAWLVALIVLPLLLLDWLTIDQPERIRRLHAQGLSQRRIADRIGCTRYRVRLALA